MKKKKVIRFVIIISIFLLIFLLVYLINGKNRLGIEKCEEPPAEKIPYDMTLVDDYSYFFSVVNIINNYLNYVKNQDTKALINILHPEYLDSYKINSNNLYENLGTFTEGLQLAYEAKNMDYKIYDNRYLYYVKGDIIENDFEDSKIIMNDVMFLVNIDYDNITYAIYPLNYLYETLPIINPQKPINLNAYNELIGSNVITKDYLCNLYLNDFIIKLNNNLENTYDLLANNFRQKSFAHKKDYLNYMQNVKDKISSQVFSCSSLSGKKKVYEVKDMNFNVFTFTEESIMNYKVEFTIN